MNQGKRLLNEGVMKLLMINEKEWEIMDSNTDKLFNPPFVVVKGDADDGLGGKIRVTIFVTKSIHASSYKLETNCDISGDLFEQKSKDGSAYSKIVVMHQNMINKDSWTLIGYSLSTSGGKLPLMVFYSPFLDPDKHGLCFYCYKDKDESDQSFYGRFGNFKPSEN